MKPTYIIFIGEKIVQLYEVTLDKISLCLSLYDIQEKESLLSFFKSNPEKKIKIIIDNAALQFSLSPLPKMAIWDKILHLKHKRDLLGEKTLFKDVRSENGLLLQSHLKSSSWVESWIKDLAYDSISFLPLEIKSYGESLDETLKKSQWMLLGILEDGFLTQIFYEKGHILSSRFTKIPSNLSTSEQQDFILKDTKQAITYLKKKGTNLPPKMYGFSVLPFEVEAFNLKPIDSFEAFLKWWTPRKPTLNFQPLNFKTPAPTQIRLGLKVATATLAGLMLLGIFGDGFDIYELSQNLKNLEIRKGQLTFKREKLEDEISTYNLPLIKAQLSKHADVLKETRKPLVYLEEVAEILANSPDIQVLDFQWNNNLKDQKVTLKLHVKAIEDQDRDVITSVFQNLNTSLVSRFGPDHVKIYKAPFNSSDSGVFSGSTRADNEAKDLSEKSGLIEVDWAW